MFKPPHQYQYSAFWNHHHARGKRLPSLSAPEPRRRVPHFSLSFPVRTRAPALLARPRTHRPTSQCRNHPVRHPALDRQGSHPPGSHHDPNLSRRKHPVPSSPLPPHQLLTPLSLPSPLLFSPHTHPLLPTYLIRRCRNHERTAANRYGILRPSNNRMIKPARTPLRPVSSRLRE